MYGLPAHGTIVAGKYRVESLLGEGGMSSVFRAHHELMDKPVALKWLRPELSQRPEAKDRFLREARASARIKHPNVVDVHDVGTHDGALYLVMELLEGESFAQLIQRGNISIPNALRLLLGAMEGVSFAHDNGIVHRDIKPENIFVVKNRVYPEGIAKILDFGISKLTDEGPGRQSLTKTGHTVGTPEYMSMEQMTGEADVDGRADVYSFGVLLYRALTGITPFSGETFAAIAVKVATSSPIPPRQLRPELPAALEQVVMRAMARQRDQRYPSMRALIEALSFLGSTQGFLSQMQNPGAGAPLLTPTPQGLGGVMPFSNFRDRTMELGPPTKALTEQTPIPIRAQQRQSTLLPMLLGGSLVAAMGIGAYVMWPSAATTLPNANSALGSQGQAGDDERPTVSQGRSNGQDRPLAQQPLDNGGAGSGNQGVAGNGAGGVNEWENHQVQVQVEQGTPPDQGNSVLDALQKAAQEAAHEGTGRDTYRPSGGGGSARRTGGARRETVTRINVGSEKPAQPEVVRNEPAAPQPSGETTKSATGRRSGTLRSDDF
jgi:serine/threonine-protein kinase